MLIVLSGPSGVGKDTLIRRMLEADRNLRYSISCTTRPPRSGEIDGVNYTFVTRERFQQLIEDGAFFEHAEYDGHLYGTLKERVERARAAGHDIVLKIDVQGAEQVREKIPDGVFIFLAPPSGQELVRRQELRNSESSENMAARRKIAELESKFASKYDHVIINDNLERAVAEALAVIRDAREREPQT